MILKRLDRLWWCWFVRSPINVYLREPISTWLDRSCFFEKLLDLAKKVINFNLHVKWIWLYSKELVTPLQANYLVELFLATTKLEEFLDAPSIFLVSHDFLVSPYGSLKHGLYFSVSSTLFFSFFEIALSLLSSPAALVAAMTAAAAVAVAAVAAATAVAVVCCRGGGSGAH